MFRIIGGSVVYGFALYGFVRFFNRPPMEAAVRPNADVEGDGLQEKDL